MESPEDRPTQPPEKEISGETKILLDAIEGIRREMSLAFIGLSDRISNIEAQQRETITALGEVKTSVAFIKGTARQAVTEALRVHEIRRTVDRHDADISALKIALAADG